MHTFNNYDLQVLFLKDENVLLRKKLENKTYLIIHDRHLIKGLRVITLGKLR